VATGRDPPVVVAAAAVSGRRRVIPFVERRVEKEPIVIAIRRWRRPIAADHDSDYVELGSVLD